MISWINKRGHFFRDVATMLSGTLVSRVVAVAAIPLLSRLFSPAEFGLLALFTTVCALLASIASGRYDMAIVLPEEPREALHLLLAAFAITALYCLLVAVGLVFCAEDIADLLSAPELADWFWLAAPMVFVLSGFTILRSWAARERRFKAVSQSTVANSLVTVGVQATLGLAQRALAGGLIIGRVAGQAAQTLLLLAVSRDDLRRAAGGGVDWPTMARLLHRYRNFPLLDTGANLLNATSRQLPVLLLGVFFSPVIVGFYSVGRRMLGIPVQLFSDSIAQVFFPKAVAEQGAGTLDSFAEGVFRRLTVAGFVPMGIGIVVMGDIIAVFLGPAWTDSVIYVQWLCLYVLAIFITAPFAQLFNVLEKQRERLIYVTLLGCLQVACLVFGGQRDDPVLAVALFSVVSAIGTMANYVWLLGKAGVSSRSLYALQLRELVWACVFATPLWLVRPQLGSSLLMLLLAAGVFGLFLVWRRRALIGGPVPGAVNRPGAGS